MTGLNGSFKGVFLYLNIIYLNIFQTYTPASSFFLSLWGDGWFFNHNIDCSGTYTPLFITYTSVIAEAKMKENQQRDVNN